MSRTRPAKYLTTEQLQNLSTSRLGAYRKRVAHQGVLGHPDVNPPPSEDPEHKFQYKGFGKPRTEEVAVIFSDYVEHIDDILRGRDEG